VQALDSYIIALNSPVAHVLWLPDASPPWRSLRRTLALRRGELAVSAVAFALICLVIAPIGQRVERSPEAVQTIVGVSFMRMLCSSAPGVRQQRLILVEAE
jgi:hypothetical protein